MNLSPTDLFLLSQCAISAAFQAGQIITQHTDSNVDVTIKKNAATLASQVVTEVDHLSQAAILRILTPTCEPFDLALLTEESPDDGQRLTKDFFWCIDPLDGTLPFIESTAGYSVAIALVSRQGIPYIGVVYDPVEQTLYHAIKGQGVFRNGVVWQIPNLNTPNQTTLTFITDRSFTQHKQYPKVIALLNTLVLKRGCDTLNIIKQGGATMNACWVIEHSPACYFKLPKPESGGGGLWDFAATACLFTEINAKVSDIQGHPLDLNRPDSTFMNHRGALYASDKQLADQLLKLYQQINPCE